MSKESPAKTVPELIKALEAEQLATKKAEARLNAALSEAKGQVFTLNGLPHRVSERKGAYYLRCMVSDDALKALKESGVIG